MAQVKTTVEIPDALFRRVRPAAVERGIPLRALVSQALADKLLSPAGGEDKPWMKAFGKLRHPRMEIRRWNRFFAQRPGSPCH